ncbi:hypothetical protein Ahy_B08g089656 isoform G [Arachis hypogaea]|uniref:Argonaute linker 2 domain-containing protein n=1 Tax=Arachis hypogaea TaxID=3818 RepID=A0A444XYH8_ARAHY|nr:hypothetical protein Ahy_B08g089656 isoform G [Arachis hypogaea]
MEVFSSRVTSMELIRERSTTHIHVHYIGSCITCSAIISRFQFIYKQTIRHNAYDQDPYAKEFGIKSEKLASVEARILPAPWVEKALEHVYHVSTTKMKGKGLELLLAILPDNNASLYGDLENL